MKLDKIKQITQKSQMTIKESKDTIKNHIHMDILGSFDIVSKSDNEDRIIAGYGNYTIIDSDNQYIPAKVLQNGIKSLLNDDGSYANIMLTHSNIQIGKIIESYGELTTHVDDNGLFLVARIRNDLEIANNVWERILDGELSSFSISGEVIESHNVCDSNSCWEQIDEINLFECSVCEFPVNKASKFTVISKSDFNSQYNDSYVDSDVCESLQKKVNNIDTMVKKKVVKAEEPKETEEKAETLVKEEVDPELREKSDFINQLMEENPKATIEDANEAWDAYKHPKEDVEKQEPEEDEEDEEEDEEDMEEKSTDDVPKGKEEKSDEVAQELTLSDALADILNDAFNKFTDKVESLMNESEKSKESQEIEKLWSEVNALKESKDKEDTINELKKSLEEKDDMIRSMEKRLKKVEDTEVGAKITMIEKARDDVDFGDIPDTYVEVDRGNVRTKRYF